MAVTVFIILLVAALVLVIGGRSRVGTAPNLNRPKPTPSAMTIAARSERPLLPRHSGEDASKPLTRMDR